MIPSEMQHLLVPALSGAVVGLAGFVLYLDRRLRAVKAGTGAIDGEIPAMGYNQGRLQAPNRAACQLFGLKAQQSVEPERLLTTDELAEFQRRIRLPDNFSMPVGNRLTYVPFSLRATHRPGEEGEELLVEMLPDRMAAANPRYIHIRDQIEAITDGAIITDTALRITAFNRRYCDITGFDPGRLLSNRISKMRSGRHDDGFYRGIWKQLATLGHWTGQIWCAHVDGRYYLQRLSISEIRNEQGVVTHYLGLLSNLSLDLQQSTDATLSTPDEQVRMMRRYIEDLRRQPYEMLHIDIERYTLIRDTFGPERGERLLADFEQRVRRTLSHREICIRTGRDEFVVMTPYRSARGASALATRLLGCMKEPFALDEIDVQVAINIGIASSNDGADLHAVRLAASSALYRARKQGLNCYEVFRPELQQQQLDSLRLESRLRSAIARDQLSLVYQPIFDAQGRIIKAEALLRWHSGEGLVPPARFIPIAEASGLIVPIGDWVIQEACRQHRCWVDQGLPPLRLAINISSYQLNSAGLLTQLKNAMAQHQVHQDYLELEITESTLMEQLDQANLVLKGCRKQGLKLAIDDFGTGYSSLAYLKDLAVDTLKIDRSFVATIDSGSAETSILDMIIQLAQRLQLKTVAEGVETECQASHLKRMGCDYFQGYLFARPMDADGVAQLLLDTQPAALPALESALS